MLRAPFPWFGDAMAYAKAHVEARVLAIDDDGRIWRTAIRVRDHWKDIQPRRAENVGGKGYLRVSLHVPDTGRNAMVMAHNLVWEVLVGPIQDGLEVNHKDLNKTNNRPDNLELVTPSGNIRHSYANGRTRPWSQVRNWSGEWRPGRPVLTSTQREQAIAMRRSGSFLNEIAAAFGISTSHAHRITS